MDAQGMPFSGQSLLAVFAHPDDESFACGGLLAWCAALGARVSLLCATNGEHGPGDAQDLATVRAGELAEAARTLGVTEVILLAFEDGMLPWVDAAHLESAIRDQIQRIQPDVVITFGEDGLYWHPDHIAIHERTTAAVAALGDEAPALYYVTIPPGRMRTVVERVAATSAMESGKRTILGIADADAFGHEASPPSLVIEALAFAGRKLAALRCHRTQVAGDVLDLLSEDDVPLLATEHFHRAGVGSSRPAFIEQLR